MVKPLQAGAADHLAAYHAMFQGTAYLRFMPVSRSLLLDAARLRAKMPLKLPDALHVATAEHAGCTTLVTNDRAFRKATDMHVVVLADVM